MSFTFTWQVGIQLAAAPPSTVCQLQGAHGTIVRHFTVYTHKSCLSRTDYSCQFTHGFLTIDSTGFITVRYKHRWASASRKLTPASVISVRYRIKKMPDCVVLLRYRTCSDIFSCFQSGTGLTGCRTVRHSEIGWIRILSYEISQIFHFKSISYFEKFELYFVKFQQSFNFISQNFEEISR
jgi:hypothetical protein